MKAKSIFVITLVICLLTTLACNSNNKTKQGSDTKDTIVVKKQEIQHTFFGVTLGKTTLQEAEDVCLKNGWQYTVQDGFGEIAVDVQSSVTFGGVQWEQGMEFCFLNNKSSYTTFNINNEATPLNNAQLQTYQTLVNKLKKLYPKHQITTDTLVNSPNKAEIVIVTNFEAKDSAYNVNLEKSIGGSRNGIILMYSIRNDKIDKIIPSDL